MRHNLIIASALTAAVFTGVAGAETLTLGIATEPTSVDPHYYNFPQNHAVADHVFNTLIIKDHRQQPTPGLALSWKPIDDKVWEFKLRQGVKFHNGQPFTADDVLFSHERAIAMKTASPPGRYQKNKTITKVDDYTIHITTGEPYPLMWKEMQMVHIVSRTAAKGKTTEDMHKGDGMIGTGAYKFVEWVSGDRVVMEPNPDFWGEKAKWSKVVFKPIKSAPSRVAALLNGDVDIIDYVPTPDVKSLKANPKVAITESPSNRVIYFWTDIGRHISPYVKDNDGNPLFPNPFQNWKVRKAISKAINRDAIVDRVMEGAAIPAGQMSPDFIFGSNPDLKPDTYDPELAKKLLAEAGYPDGFRLTAHGPNDRYVNDEKLVQTVAAMLTRVGIKTEVQTFPRSVYFSRSSRGGEYGLPEFSFYLMGSGSNLGDGLSQLQFSHGTNGLKANYGVGNRGRYSNPIVDYFLLTAFTTIDDAKREKLVQQAVAVAVKEYAFIPTHYQKNIWAHRPDLTYVGHTNEKTKAMLVGKK